MTRMEQAIALVKRITDLGGTPVSSLSGRCENLMLPTDSNLLVTGNALVEGVACAATRDSSGAIGGNLRASIVVSGLGAGAFACGGEVCAGSIHDYVSNLGGKGRASQSTDSMKQQTLRSELLEGDHPCADRILEYLMNEGSLFTS